MQWLPQLRRTRSQRTSPARPKPKRARGFALVVALALMAFLLVLLLSFVTVVRVETKNAATGMEQLQARTNAILAAKVALGELQRAAGPDQRLTARADLLAKDPSPTEGRRLWTGVRATARPSGEAVDLPTLRGDPALAGIEWLVSGDAPEPANPGGTGDPVVLARYASDPANGNIDAEVNVEPETIAGGGRFAWYVSDETQKADVSTPGSRATNPTAGSANDLWHEELGRFFLAARPGFAMLSGFDPAEWDALPPESFARIGRQADLPLLGATSPDDMRTFHADLTAGTFGLHTNVRDGGLKQDLSHGLGDGFAEHLAGRPIFSDPEAGLYSTLWDNVYTWSQNYRTRPALAHRPAGSYGSFGGFTFDLVPGTGDPASHTPSGIDGMTDATMEAAAPLPVDSDTSHRAMGLNPALTGLTPFTGDFWGLDATDATGVRWRLDGATDPPPSGNRPSEPLAHLTNPVVLEAVVRYGISAVEADPGKGEAPGAYIGFRIHQEPFFKLWNPYNVAIEVPRTTYWWNFNPFVWLQRGNGRPVALQRGRVPEVPAFYNPPGNLTVFKIPGGASMLALWNNALPGGGTNDLRLPVTIGGFRMEPGEIVLRSLSNNFINYKSLETRADFPGRSGHFVVSAAATNSGETAANYIPFRNALRRNPEGLPDFLLDSVNFEPNLPDNPVLDLGIDRFSGSDFDLWQMVNIPGLDGMKRGVVARHLERLQPGTEDGESVSFPVNRPVSAFANPQRIDRDDTTMRVHWFGAIVAELKAWDTAADADLPGPAQTNPLAWTTARTNAQTASPAAYKVRYLPNDGEVDDFPDTEQSFLDLEADRNWDSGFGYWGASHNEGPGTGTLAFSEIPRQPLHSLGQLAHANLGGWDTQPAYVAGNAYAPLFVPRDRRFVRKNGVTTGIGDRSDDVLVAVDQSWYINDALFDDFFFSTVPPRDPGFATTAYPPFEPVDADFVADPSKRLPNKRMWIFRGGEPAADVADALHDFDTAAGHLFAEGAFNVNATSEAAWKTVLASAASNTFKNYDGSNETIGEDAGEGYAFSRFATPAQGADAAFSGIREVSESELDDLAAAIVEEVREHGPFLSLADFVNRRVESSDAGLKGPLQAALDATLNDPSEFGGAPDPDAVDALWDGLGRPENAAPAVGAGFPGWLLQSDLLQQLAPYLTVRGDTFTIRAYGQAPETAARSNPAEAWCEMVVQRVPRYIDDANPPRTPADNDRAAERDLAPLTPTNRRFGREFEIVGFRWIDEDQL